MNKTKKVSIWVLFPIMLVCFLLAALFGIGQRKAYALTPNFWVESANVRLDEYTGMRFIAAMTDDYYQEAIEGNGENGKYVSFGVLIVPNTVAGLLTDDDYIPSLAAWLEAKGASFTVDDCITNSIAMQNTDIDGNLIDNNATDWYIKGSVSNMLYKNYNLAYVAIGFVKTTTDGGESYSYAYSDMLGTPIELTNAASKSLNKAGYENNAVLQGFVTKGIYQANGEDEATANGATYEGLKDYLGLNVGLTGATENHADVGDTINYTITSSTSKSFDKLDIKVKYGETEVSDGSFDAEKGHGVLAVKNGNTTYVESDTLYVGNEALDLYDDFVYDQATNGRTIQHLGQYEFVSTAWGLSSYSDVGAGKTAVETDTYNTKYGENVSTAYKLSADSAKMNASAKPFKLLDFKIKLTDANYVFNNYNAVTVRLNIGNLTNAPDAAVYSGIYLEKKEIEGNNVYYTMCSNYYKRIINASEFTSGANGYSAGWKQFTFAMPDLSDAYSDSAEYYLTFGMDLRTAWNSVDVYIGNVMFNEKYDVSSEIEFQPNSTFPTVNADHWGYGGTVAQNGASVNLSNTLQIAYKNRFGEKYDGSVYKVTPSVANLNGRTQLQGMSAAYNDKIGESFTASTDKIKYRVYVEAFTTSTGEPVSKTIKATAGTFNTTVDNGTNPAITISPTRQASITTNTWVEITHQLPPDNAQYNLKCYAYGRGDGKLDNRLFIAFVLGQFSDVKSDVTVNIYLESMWIEK